MLFSNVNNFCSKAHYGYYCKIRKSKQSDKKARIPSNTGVFSSQSKTMMTF